MYRINDKETTDFINSVEFEDFLEKHLSGTMWAYVQRNLLEIIKEQNVIDNTIIEEVARYLETDNKFYEYLSTVVEEPELWQKRLAYWIREHKK